MNDAVRSEWIKFRTVRANVVLTIIAIAAPLVITVLIVSLSDFRYDEPRDVFGALVGPSFVCAFLASVLGVLGIGQEYRHNTIRVTFAAQPRRSVVLGAKTLVYGAFGLAIGVLTPLLCIGVGGTILSLRNVDYTVDWAPVAGQAVFCLLMTWFGFGLGCCMRQPAGTIPTLLVWALVGENIVGAVLNAIDDKLLRWLPFAAGIRTGVPGEAGEQFFGRVASGLYFAGWTAAVVALGWWLVERRDA